MKPKLRHEDFERAAAAIGCEVATVKAVCIVEAPNGGFLPDGRPTILFERHIFSRRTMGVYDSGNSDISNRSPGGYKGGAAEHDRLARAAILERDAALESASWGKFQIMGFNHAAAGHPTLQGFVNAMYHSEGRQMDAFVAFILHEGLADEMREHRWTAFARRFNGPGYAANRYDIRLAAAYRAVTV